MGEMQALSKSDPRVKAWEEYQASDNYKNSFHWAAQDAHRKGSMWAAFIAGWHACHNQGDAPDRKAPTQQDKTDG